MGYNERTCVAPNRHIRVFFLYLQQDCIEPLLVNDRNMDDSEFDVALNKAKERIDVLAQRQSSPSLHDLLKTETARQSVTFCLRSDSVDLFTIELHRVL